MASLLDSTRNTRSILPESLRYLRSDVPERLSDKEINWLVENEILTVIDLRTALERSKKPSCLEDDSRFRYFAMPVTGGNAIPESPEAVTASYIRMADEQMDKILERILKTQTGVLYFCNEGKDRTGVVSAMLLKYLGFDREYIIRDYLESGENLRELLEAFAAEHHVDIRIITPCRSPIWKPFCTGWNMKKAGIPLRMPAYLFSYLPASARSSQTQPRSRAV